MTVTPSAPSLFIGDTQQFKATGTFSDGSTSDLTATVTWSSSNAQVATITSGGLATVKASGSATITAASGTLSNSTTLKASAKLVSVTVTPASASIPLGLTQPFKATGAYNDGSSNDVTSSATWSSSSTAVATVNAAGLAASVAAGSATITAALTPTGRTSAVSGTGALTVGPAVSVSLSPAAAAISVGGAEQFTAVVSNTTNTAVTWSVDGVAGGNASTGSVSATGLYTTPAGPGSHIVSAASQRDPSKSGRATATVAYAGMTTYHNDLSRTGQNLNETTLTPSNVNSTEFGKLFSYAVDGAIYGQPLYVSAVTISGQGVHNVVYVATMHDSVYAFDADGKTSSPLWHTSFLKSGVTTVNGPAVSDFSIPTNEIGVLSTPVIDASTGTLFAVAYTAEGGAYVYRLHALDITSGAERFGGPVVIQAQAAGTGESNNGHGQVPFSAVNENQRTGLLLLNGVVYIGFASHEDTPPWHGWLLGYSASTLQQTAVFNVTPNGSHGGLWASGGAPAADSAGAIYASSGNGTFDVNTGGADFGDSILKLQSGTLSMLDWFSPFNTAELCSIDLDLGSGGVVLLPDQPGAHPHLLTVAGKEGRIYLIDRDNLGHFNATSDQAVQELVGAILPANLSTPTYWQGNLYYASQFDTLKMFTLSNGLLSTAPVAVTPESFGYAGATASVSSNGSSGGVLWVLDTSALGTATPAAVLRAFDATNVAHEFYNSAQAGSRDTLGTAGKFFVPTIFNGKVYAGTATELDVFGLLAK